MRGFHFVLPIKHEKMSLRRSLRTMSSKGHSDWVSGTARKRAIGRDASKRGTHNGIFGAKRGLPMSNITS